MAARRGCVNSLWSGSERVRIGERLKATLAGVLELELLRCKHLELVDGALEERGGEPRAGGSPENGGGDAGESAATSRRQQAPSPSDMATLPCQSSPEDSCSNSGDGTVHSSSSKGTNSRWSTLSWDAPSDLLSPPTPDPSGALQLDSDSRPSSGFYSVSGSSLSDSSYSVSSDAAQGGLVPPARPLKLWEQGPVSADNTDILWSDGIVQQQQQQQEQQLPPTLHTSSDNGDPIEETPLTVSSDLDVTGLNFLTDLCSGLGQSLISSLIPILDPATAPSNPSNEQRPQLDPRYCTDLVSRRTKEVYPYPSPLHAVALQSPLFTSQNQEQSASDGSPPEDQPESTADLCPPLQPRQPTAPPTSVTHLEQYISRLARQYHSRVNCSVSDPASVPGAVSHRGLCTPGKGHGSTQSLSAFESRSATTALPGGSATPCKSLLGKSARISLSTNGKKATRNSINLGNLPSATGEDFNINLHLNLNLNLAPGLNSSRGPADNPKNISCGALRGDAASSPAVSAASLSSSAPTPALRTRPRISTCPSTLSHRSSLEVAPIPNPSSSGGFGSAAFSRSLDWSSCAQPEAPSVKPFAPNSGSAPGSQRSSYIQEAGSSPKLSEDSPVVGEISRLSGLSRAVVVGLMEQGVELDIDCFQGDTTGELKGHSKNHLSTHTDDYTRVIDLNPQRPIQLSLSVTHSPQSQSSLTPPLSHSSSPIHPYQSIHVPPANYSPHCLYQQIPSPSDPPSSTASSPASRPTQRGRSPPRPLQASPMGATPLTVFRRDAPFQCSLPRTNARSSPFEHGGIQPRGGSLRHSGGGEGGGGWKRVEGDGLYRGKHASHKLIRAATVSSYAHREDYSSGWGEEEQKGRSRKNPGKFSRGFEGRFWGKECESEREEVDRAEYGYGWTRTGGGSWRTERRRVKAAPGSHDRKPKVESSPIFSKRRGREEGERRSSSLRLSRRALFRSESQGLLVPRGQGEEPSKRAHWVSSLDVGHGGVSGKDEGLRLLRAKQDKRLSSTASLFNLSRSQSLEGSCHSLSPLSSPSFSPSPPPRAPLQRSRSLRDLGRKVFGSMRSLSLKRKPSKK